MSALQRLGMALVAPRWALAIARDRKHAGRSGSDLMLGLLALLVATSLRFVVEAVWAAVSEDAGLGLRLLLATLTGTLTVPLGFLVIAAAILWLTTKDLGRAFDLACVAVVPFLAIDLGGRSLAFTFHLPVPRIAVVALTGAAFAWAGILVAFASMSRGARAPEVADGLGRRAGWVLAGLAAIGTIGQGVWVVQHLDRLRPMRTGDPAPELSLPRILADGSLGELVSLAPLRGKVVVLDFWATWCGPCLASMPKLDAYAKQHPEVAVLAINTDDPAEARALFSEKHYGLELIADTDGQVSRAYHVETIPHTVVIDAAGNVRNILHGSGHDLASVVDKVKK